MLNKEKIIEYAVKYKVYIIASVSALVLIIAMVLILNIDNGGLPILDDETNTYTNIELPSDILQIESIIEEVDLSDIDIISNRQYEQADIIMEEIGVDTDSLFSYAGSIDPSIDGVHAILIVRPKDEYYEQIKLNLVYYINDKIVWFKSTNQDAKVIIAEESGIYEEGGYIILVLEEYSDEIIQDIVSSLRKAFPELNNKEDIEIEITQQTIYDDTDELIDDSLDFSEEQAVAISESETTTIEEEIDA